MKVKQLISILLMLLLLTACSANTDLDLPDEAGSSEQTSNMDASAAEPEDGAEKPTLPEIETPEGAPDAELVETLLVTVVDNINGENTDDGVELVIYAYDEQSQAFRVIFKTPIGPYVYPANTVDFEHQIVYYASARPDETYDNLYSCDLKTGNVQRLTDGKNAFNDLLFVDGTLYANVAREFCTTCQPARFDLDSQTFTYRNEADDDTWHHSFSYDDYADSDDNRATDGQWKAYTQTSGHHLAGGGECGNSRNSAGSYVLSFLGRQYPVFRRPGGGQDNLERLPLCAGHAGTDAAHVPQTARPDH